MKLCPPYDLSDEFATRLGAIFSYGRNKLFYRFKIIASKNIKEKLKVAFLYDAIQILISNHLQHHFPLRPALLKISQTL